ncbi:DUF4105 domain-containing protein [Candidatus Poseidoniales archaeon]|nr:DUF4105 domain-containing protein [Candidatus Thalassarchaeaceae archaeon]MDC0041051.1 DUF4105 domain-containing protein [Candidatus Poseidoniales archaeon]RCH71656.1 MAG: DUF4105 domain-containing protein [Candidatus Poseidoniales archaeon]RCH72403.1 MAG: DUF4105 domain-containing protein [Candidatus Poseidoniales archaeon]
MGATATLTAVLTVFTALAFLFLAAVWIRVHKLRPSNDRSWVNDNERNATIEFDGDIAKITNLRDFNWRSSKDFDERWINEDYDLKEVESIWLTLEYFDQKLRQMAHTILSFEFKDGRRLACSIEVRREKGERYHPVRGLFREYELIYVWAKESDVIGVRTRCRKNSVTHLFKAVVLGEGNERRMLESYLNRTNDLVASPEWYNTLTNTCTTNIVRHVNEVYPGRVPRAISILMPGLSPKLLERANLIKMSGTLDETLAASVIDAKAKAWDGESDFGDAIRA